MSGSPGTGGSNPRKFSEKIALHNQKQAEETRAFEQLMTDLNVSRVNNVSSSWSPLSLSLSVCVCVCVCNMFPLTFCCRGLGNLADVAISVRCQMILILPSITFPLLPPRGGGGGGS